MMKKSKKIAALAGISAFCLSVAGCGSSSGNTDNNKAGTENTDESVKADSGSAEENSKKAQAAAGAVKYREAESKNPSCKITLNGNSAECKGSGAEFADGVLRITEAGCYEITGELDGRIEVSADKEDTVEIILNGVEVTCSDYAPFVVWQADRTLVYLAEGTTNQFTDGGSYYVSGDSGNGSAGDGTDSSAADADSTAEEAPSAAFFSKDDLGFSGSGTLLVTANCNDGITGKDDVWFTGGTYKVTARDDGIVGKDSVAVKDGDFTIEAEGDGIKSTKEEDAGKGFVALKDGKFTITADNDGIQASTYVWVEGGTFDITAGGGSKNVTQNTGMMDRKGSMSFVQADNEESCKGLKAGVDISILGGNFTMDCADDTIHSNDTVTIKGGTFAMKSGDDGIHGDQVAVIDGGTITIEESYEGIEAESIIIRDGKIDVTASDDGLNAADGESAEGMDGPGGWHGMEGGRGQTEQGGGPGSPETATMSGVRPENQDARSGVNSSGCILTVEGGEVYVNAGGDGLDSNGSIIMGGGTVYVDGPVNDGNGILDYEYEMVMNGGSLFGAGSSGMLQSVSENSAQPGLAVVFESAQNAGTKVTLKDSDGKEIVSYEPSKTFTAIVVSNDKLELGETYEVYLGNEKYISIQLSSISTSNGKMGMGNGMKGGHGGGMKDEQNMDGSMTAPDGGKGRQNGSGMTRPDMENIPSDGERNQDRPDAGDGDSSIRDNTRNKDRDSLKEDNSI